MACAEMAETSTDTAVQEKTIWDAYEERCVEHCGLYQEEEKHCRCKEDLTYNGKECEIPKSADWRKDKYLTVCTAEDRFASIDGTACQDGCGDNEEPEKGVCACDKDSIINEDGKGCTTLSKCDRVRDIGGVRKCLNATKCHAGTKLATEGQECIPSCDQWVIVGGEDQCQEKCPEATPAHPEGLCTTCREHEGENSENVYWDEAVKKCVKLCSEGTAVPLGGGEACVGEHGENEVIREGHWVCSEKAALAVDEKSCVIPNPESGECRRVLEVDG